MPFAVLVILAAVLTADLLLWLRADRFARRQPYPRAWRWAVGVFMGGQVALLVWVMGGRVQPDSALGRPPQLLAAAGFVWHLLVLPATWAAVGATAAVSVARRLASRRTEPVADPAPAPTRRELLGSLAAAAPAVLTVAAAGYARGQLQEFRVRDLDVALPDLPPDLDGVRLAVVSDLHVGNFTTGPTVKRIVEATSRLGADLVLLPGDLIDHALADLPLALDAVADLQSRHGSYLCVGNHDLIEDGAEFVRRVKARAPLLVGESRVVAVRGHPVQLLGLPWDRDEGRTAEAVRALAGRVEPGAFPVLLAHHPHAFDAAAAAGLPLTLSGHTHGGQLMLGERAGFGPLMFRYWSGLYRKPGGAALVVSNGAGNWFPLRVGAPAEVVHLTLRRAAAGA